MSAAPRSTITQKKKKNGTKGDAGTGGKMQMAKRRATFAITFFSISSSSSSSCTPSPFKIHTAPHGPYLLRIAAIGAQRRGEIGEMRGSSSSASVHNIR